MPHVICSPLSLSHFVSYIHSPLNYVDHRTEQIETWYVCSTLSLSSLSLWASPFLHHVSGFWFFIFFWYNYSLYSVLLLIRQPLSLSPSFHVNQGLLSWPSSSWASLSPVSYIDLNPSLSLRLNPLFTGEWLQSWFTSYFVTWKWKEGEKKSIQERETKDLCYCYHRYELLLLLQAFVVKVNLFLLSFSWLSVSCYSSYWNN